MFFRFKVVSLVCVVALLVGCGSGPDVSGFVGKKNETNPQKVANSLFLYQARTGKVCKSEEELCDFIENNPRIEKNLSLMQIDKSTFPGLLVSERDGEPFFIRYGAAIPSMGKGVPLVFETVGVEGERRIGWSDASLTTVTDEKEYKRLKAGKYKKEKFQTGSAEAAQ